MLSTIVAASGAGLRSQPKQPKRHPIVKFFLQVAFGETQAQAEAEIADGKATKQFS